MIDPTTLPPALQQQIADYEASIARPPAEQLAPADDQTPAPPAAEAAASHPFTVGQLVSYATVDPVTDDKLAGVGIVVDAPTFGDGSEDNPIGHNVAIARLHPDLYLAAGDVKAVAT